MQFPFFTKYPPTLLTKYYYRPYSTFYPKVCSHYTENEINMRIFFLPLFSTSWWKCEKYKRGPIHINLHFEQDMKKVYAKEETKNLLEFPDNSLETQFFKLFPSSRRILLHKIFCKKKYISIFAWFRNALNKYTQWKDIASVLQPLLADYCCRQNGKLFRIWSNLWERFDLFCVWLIGTHRDR